LYLGDLPFLNNTVCKYTYRLYNLNSLQWLVPPIQWAFCRDINASPHDTYLVDPTQKCQQTGNVDRRSPRWELFIKVIAAAFYCCCVLICWREKINSMCFRRAIILRLKTAIKRKGECSPISRCAMTWKQTRRKEQKTIF
jgi:hypothetical protein